MLGFSSFDSFAIVMTRLQTVANCKTPVQICTFEDELLTCVFIKITREAF